MANPFVHVELHTQDPEKAKNFYGRMFGWKFEEMADMDYTIIKVGQGTGGGILKTASKAAWVPYVLVNDIGVFTEKAASNGAELLTDVTEIPRIGWFSMFRDPAGASFAMLQLKMDSEANQ